MPQPRPPQSTPATSAGAPDGRGRTYATLDGLRGVAALFVVLFHFNDDLLSPHGYLAVDLFFAMSGFVIASAYERRLTGGLGVGGFLGIRLRRLAPMWMAGVALGLALVLAVPTAAPARTLILLALPALLLVPHGLSFDGAFPMNTSLWSLHVELVVNIVFAWAHRFLATWVLLSVAAASFIALAAIAYGQGTLSQGASPVDLASGYLRALTAFPLGVVLWRWRDRLTAFKFSAPLLLLIAAALFTGLGVGPKGVFGVTYDLAFIGLAIPALVVIAARNEPPAWLRLLFSRMGSGSYALYALHAPVIQAARRLALTHGGAPTYLAMGVVLIPGLIAMAWLVDRLIDAPLQRRLKAWRAAPAPAHRLEPAGGLS